MLFDFSDTITGKSMSNKLIHANFFFFFPISSCFTLKTSLRFKIVHGKRSELTKCKNK